VAVGLASGVGGVSGDALGQWRGELLAASEAACRPSILTNKTPAITDGVRLRAAQTTKIMSRACFFEGAASCASDPAKILSVAIAELRVRYLTSVGPWGKYLLKGRTRP
jgi:hypothetical protein